MNNFIDYIFGACCGMMFGMGELFGTTYEFVNVILFCYVEPILTVLMICAAAYVLLKGPYYKTVGKIFKWFAIATGIITFVLLIISGLYALHIVDIMNLDSSQFDAIISRVYRADPSPHIHKLYKWTYDWLMRNSSDGAWYNTLNLLVYVLAMPALIIPSILICHKYSK